MIQIAFTVSQDAVTQHIFNHVHEVLLNVLMMNESVTEFTVTIGEKRTRDDVTQRWCKTDKMITFDIITEEVNYDD
jgi:hypothetical protein